MAISPERKAQLDAYVAAQKAAKEPLRQPTGQVASPPPSALGKAGSALMGLGRAASEKVFEPVSRAIFSPVTRTAATTISTGRGIYNLATGNIAAEQAAQAKEAQRPLEYQPVRTAAETLGVGLQLGTMIGAGGLTSGVNAAAPLASATARGAFTGAVSGLAAGAGKGFETAGSEGKGVIEAGEQAFKGGATGAVVGAAIGGAIGGVEDYRRGAAAAASKKVDKAVGQIAQSKVGDVAQHKRALLRISPEERAAVKTYSDLNSTIDDNLAAVRQRQDAHLAQFTDDVPLQKFERTVGTGKAAVTDNPVVRALDGLEELYRNTNDPDSLSAVLALKEKAATSGLTVSEVNQVARDYGAELGTKGFNQRTGDALTSVNAQSFENTRKAVKEAARSLMPDKQSQAMDHAMSDLLELQRTTKQIEEKVNSSINKIQQRGVIEKIGRALGIAVDKLTFGGPRAFITKALFPRGVGAKEMTYLDIQEALPKNLKLLDAIINSSTDDELVKAAVNAIRPPLGGAPALDIADDITPPVRSAGPGAVRMNSPELSGPRGLGGPKLSAGKLTGSEALQNLDETMTARNEAYFAEKAAQLAKDQAAARVPKAPRR